MLTPAQAFGIAQWGITYAALDKGVGKRVAGVERTDDSPHIVVAKVGSQSRTSKWRLTDREGPSWSLCRGS